LGAFSHELGRRLCYTNPRSLAAKEARPLGYAICRFVVAIASDGEDAAAAVVAMLSATRERERTRLYENIAGAGRSGQKESAVA